VLGMPQYTQVERAILIGIGPTQAIIRSNDLIQSNSTTESKYPRVVKYGEVNEWLHLGER